MNSEITALIKNIRRLTTMLEFATMADPTPEDTLSVANISAGIIGDVERVQALAEGTAGK